MAKLLRNPLKWFWWLRAPFFWWVKTKVVPQDPMGELEIDPNKPVCYILPHRSISDLMIFERTCREKKLPLPYLRPSALHNKGASYIYVAKMGLFQVARNRRHQLPTPLGKLVSRTFEQLDLDVQLVPVSLFWGRNPGSNERSLFKLLFFDEERAGILQKIFIILAQGRNTLVNIGNPISLRDLVDEGLPPEQTARKLQRVLRVHFRRQRVASMGPQQSDRGQVINAIVSSRSVRRAIAEESTKKKTPIAKIERKARYYVNEVAANQTPSVVRFFEIILSKMWNRIFNGIVTLNADVIRGVAQDHEVVYLPCHRSHMDYLLLGYVLYMEGLMPPHTAAGINLNFWPAGPLLRRGGAFYLRRSFRGNRLYTAVFNEYFEYLMNKGHSVNFFLEGGRSRTGKLLQPKTGMLSMVVNSYLKGLDKPIVFIPTYIGYERVVEVKSYLRELRGRSKSKESVRQLLGARKILKTNLGKVYVNFGKPIFLDEYINELQPDWQQEYVPDNKPKWLTPAVNGLASKALTSINGAACVNPVCLCALVLLSCSSKAISEEELGFVIDKLLTAFRLKPYTSSTHIAEGGAIEYVTDAESMGTIKRFKHPSGDVFYIEDGDAPLLTYYRNNIIHIIAMPSLIASFFQHNDVVSEKTLIKSCQDIYPFLKSEYFLRWQDREEVGAAIQKLISVLVEIGLLRRIDEDELARPEVTTMEFNALRILGRALGTTLERYSISIALLAGYAESEGVERGEFERQCQLMAQRVSLLNGMNDPEFYDKAVFRNFVEMLRRLEYLDVDPEGMVKVDTRMESISERSLGLLSMDIRQSIKRVTAVAGRDLQSSD